jgi:lactoylglutathione lyase
MKLLWTTIYVKNLEESVTFYSDLLGLKVLRRFPAGPTMEIAFMGNGTDNETLVELMTDKNNAVNHGESVVLGFDVNSVDEMLDMINSKKIAVLNGPFETPASRFFTIKDPNGLNVQFFQRK